MFFVFFFFKQKTAYEIMPSLVGSEMCIRDRISTDDRTDAGDGLCGEESTGISDAGGDQSEFWKYIWFS